MADGSLAVLASDADLAAAWAQVHAIREWASPQKRILRHPHLLAKTATAQILVLGQAGWIASARFPLKTPFPLFDRLATGDWLVVPSRTERKARDGRMIAPDGSVRHRLMLGDGIEHVGIDAADRIWIGWFDEGVFGNDGWTVAGRAWPPSSRGVAAFSSDGEVLPDLGWPEEVDAVADCYALNVSGNGAWVCTYPEFPIVRFVPGKPIRWWRNAPAGCRALAVDGDRVLVAGGYAGQANRVTLLGLDEAGTGDDARVVMRWTLPLRRRHPATSGHEWAEPDLLAGRGDTIHLVAEGVWRRWRVADLCGRAERS